MLIEDARISYAADHIVCFVVSVLLMGVLALPAGSQELVKSVPPNLEKAVNELRTLYQDMYMRFEDVRIFREAGNENRADDLTSELRSEIRDRLKNINQLLNNVNTNERSMKKRIQHVRSMMNLFDRYQRKFLSDWEPENPKLLEAFNREELIQREMASPNMLRKRFLTELLGVINTEGYVMENVVVSELNSAAEQVQTTYRNALNTFLGLLNRIDRARNNENQDVQEVIEEANRKWASFWEGFQEDRTALRETINRTLILYRGREHLTSAQQIRYEKGVRLKREFGEIMEFRKSVSKDNLFANQKAVYTLLVLMGKKYGRRLVSLLNENTTAHFSMMQKFIQNKGRLERVSSEEEYNEVRADVDAWLEEAVYGEFDLEAAVKRIRKVPVQRLSSLIQRLNANYGKKEKQLAAALEGLRTYTIDFFNFSETARSVTEAYVERFKEVSFSSREQFQNVFPGPLRKKVNSINQKQEELDVRLDELEEQFDSVIEQHFSSDPVSKSPDEQ